MSTLDSKLLHPRLPPGRADRKALAYCSEIQRLRALGYTFEAIRIALADAGVDVGLTTVRREAARFPAASEALTRMPTPVPAVAPTSEPADAVDRPAFSAPPGSGKDIAEKFCQSHVSNPLLRHVLESTRHHHGTG